MLGGKAMSATTSIKWEAAKQADSATTQASKVVNALVVLFCFG